MVLAANLANYLANVGNMSYSYVEVFVCNICVCLMITKSGLFSMCMFIVRVVGLNYYIS